MARLTRRCPSAQTADLRTSSTDPSPSLKTLSTLPLTENLTRRLPPPPWIDIPPHPATAYLRNYVADANQLYSIPQPRSHPLPQEPSLSLPCTKPRARTARSAMPSRSTHSVRRVSSPAHPSTTLIHATDASHGHLLAESPVSYAPVSNSSINSIRLRGSERRRPVFHVSRPISRFQAREGYPSCPPR